MAEIFIENIYVKDVRNIKDFNIPASTNERMHIILTGKNGCGKTSLLNGINKYFQWGLNGGIKSLPMVLRNKEKFETQIRNIKESNLSPQEKSDQLFTLESNLNHQITWLAERGGVEIKFQNTNDLQRKIENGTFILAFFDSKRHVKLNVPLGINKVNLGLNFPLEAKVNQQFIQYIVNLVADRSFARDEQAHESVEKIDLWFKNFEDKMRDIFDAPSLKLKFDRKNYNFEIIEEGKKPYGFESLSDGYSAIISITSELLLRMEAHESKNYDLEGIVLIDEIETHLHVDLQKKILPFLISFFPKIQFIVSTHSPFVLSSVSNAVICDLHKKFITTDLSGYSYDALIESYFNSDKYSDEIKEKIEVYERLSENQEMTDIELVEFKRLKKYFESIPEFLNDELIVKLQQIKLNTLKV